MDPFLRSVSFRPPIVVLAISDRELLAMMSLMLEMAGFRAMPLADLGRFDAAIRDLSPRAIIIDARDGNEPAWTKVRHVQAAPATIAAQVIVITAGGHHVPTDLLERGAQLLIWPFPLTDLFLMLDDP